jgi:hypothetical protein
MDFLTEMLIWTFPDLLLRTPPCWNKRNWNNIHDGTNLNFNSAAHSTAQTASFVYNYGTSLWMRFSVTNPLSPQLVFKHLPYLVEKLWNSWLKVFRRVPNLVFFLYATYEDGTDTVPKRWHIKFKRRGITHKKQYNTFEINSSKNLYRSLNI